MKLVLDAGAFIALERGDRAMFARLKSAMLENQDLITHAGVIAQIWRGGSGAQVHMVRALKMVDVLPFDNVLAKQVGLLLSRAPVNDIVDAGVVMIANNGDRILTSDPDDLHTLAVHSGKRLDVVSV